MVKIFKVFNEGTVLLELRTNAFQSVFSDKVYCEACYREVHKSGVPCFFLVDLYY